MDVETLHKLAAWADARIASGAEPPWTYTKLSSLSDICTELAAGMGATTRMESPQPEGELADNYHPGAENIVALDKFRPRRAAPDPLSLPT